MKIEKYEKAAPLIELLRRIQLNISLLKKSADKNILIELYYSSDKGNKQLAFSVHNMQLAENIRLLMLQDQEREEQRLLSEIEAL